MKIDPCAAPGLRSYQQALETLLAAANCCQPHQTCLLANADGRILASDIVAPINVPGYDNSAMDGYAFRFADSATGQPLRLIGEAFAGHPWSEPVAPGCAVRIMTGAPLPPDCDSVEMQENVDAEGQHITLRQAIKAGQHVRRTGEDISVGHRVFESGRRLRPADLGLIASLGIDTVEVYQPLKVALFSTGDELTPPGQPLASGAIYESNRVVLRAMLARLGMEITDLGIVADDTAALTEAFKTAAQSADVVITSGGVSVGEADYTNAVLAELGEIGFWKVAIKPGKPFSFGRLSKFTNSTGRTALFMGLPGNPVSAAVTLHQLALPALRKLAGEVVPPPTQYQLPLRTAIKRKPGRLEFVRAIATTDSDGSTTVAATGSQGSGILTSVSRANGYVVLPAEAATVDAGEIVTFLPFDGVMGGR